MSHDISSVTVLGGGTMGAGIAQMAALAGYQTQLFDLHASALEKAESRIQQALQKGVQKGKVAAEAAAQATEKLSFTISLEGAVADAGLIIEAVPEDMALKIRIFAEVAAHAPQDALFASNTSGLSITEMAGASDRPERFAGMHFFNPVHLMKLVEVVRGLETSEETLRQIEDVAVRMGKETVLVNESPGFVTSRINVLIGNEAFRMLESGVASARDIDKALKLGLNHPMGPFEMVDLVGLDVRLSVLRHLHATLGDTYRPSNLLVQHVKAGRLGRKVGRGVYTYEDGPKPT